MGLFIVWNLRLCLKWLSPGRSHAWYNWHTTVASLNCTWLLIKVSWENQLLLLHCWSLKLLPFLIYSNFWQRRQDKCNIFRNIKLMVKNELYLCTESVISFQLLHQSIGWSHLYSQPIYLESIIYDACYILLSMFVAQFCKCWTFSSAQYLHKNQNYF